MNQELLTLRDHLGSHPPLAPHILFDGIRNAHLLSLLCIFVLCFVCLCLVCPIFPVYLDCLFFIIPSVFSTFIYFWYITVIISQHY